MNMRIVSAGLVATLVLAAVGCTSSKPEAPSGEKSGQAAAGGAAGENTAYLEKLTLGGVKPAASDTLLQAYPDDPDTLNPITSSDNVSEAFQRQVCEYLAYRDFGDPDTFVPALAESWEFDEPNLEFTIHLRKGVKWHPMTLPDGTPLPETEFTSRDVKFSFDCVLNPSVEAAHIRSYYENRVTVTPVDKYTVKVRWSEPYFLAEEYTLYGVPMIPRHVYSVDEHGEPISLDFSSAEFAEGFNNHWANTRLCGTGPMRFQEWKRNERLVLVRNPDYWGAPYYFSRVVMRAISNPNTVLQLALAGDLDSAGISEKDQYIQAKDNANVKAGKVKLFDYDYPGYRYIGYNLDREIFKDKRVRWALSHAVPIDTIIQNVFHGLATPVSGPFLPGSSSSDPSIAPVPYDLDKARALLDEAGWKDTDQDGVRDKLLGGAKVPLRYDLMIYSDTTMYRTIAELIKENCRQIGVDVQITPAAWALMLQKLRKREFDAAMLGWSMSWTQDPYQLWHSSQADEPDSSNHVAYRNPEVDKAIEELRVTFDHAKQVELYHKIHRLIYDDQPYTFLLADKATGAANGRIENIHFYRLRPGLDSREWYSSTPRTLGQ